MNNSVGAESEPKVDTASDAGGDVQHLPQLSHRSPYEVGEKVLAYHYPFFYEAKVEKVEFEEDWRFYIHYWRWRRSWDEWMGVDRLLKFTEENLQRVSHDKKQVTDVKAGRLSQTKFDPSGKRSKHDSALKSRKRKRERCTVKGKYDLPVDKLVNISIPPMLKKQLLDDFDFINRMGKLVKLPRTPSVDDIIKKYEEYRRKKDLELSTSFGEFLSGLCGYFNKALPVMLLYKEERKQYQEAITENMSSSAVYGAEHLLRLFVKLPTLLYDLKIEERTLQDLQQNLHYFLKFLQKNQSVFFLSTYHVPEHPWRSTDKECN